MLRVSIATGVAGHRCNVVVMVMRGLSGLAMACALAIENDDRGVESVPAAALRHARDCQGVNGQRCGKQPHHDDAGKTVHASSVTSRETTPLEGRPQGQLTAKSLFSSWGGSRRLSLPPQI
jgi:hypothetical protein